MDLRKGGTGSRRGPGWQDRALCEGEDPEVFFPRPGRGADRARALCAACPVRPECLADALENSARHGPGLYGIWGGTTERERRRLRRKTGGDVTAAVALALGTGPAGEKAA